MAPAKPTRTDRRIWAATAKRERGKIALALCQLRQNAKAVPDARVIVAGWSFMLTIGKDDAVWAEDPAMMRQALQATLGPTSQRSVDADRCDGRCGQGHQHYHFSARPYPVPRGTVGDDWENLGIATKAVGMPKRVFDAAEDQIADELVVHTRAIHYFWHEPYRPGDPP